MSTTLSAMTAAKLINELHRLNHLFGYFNMKTGEHPEDNRGEIHLEIKSRCYKAGIKINPDNTISIPAFIGNYDDLGEFITLINYMKGGSK